MELIQFLMSWPPIRIFLEFTAFIGFLATAAVTYGIERKLIMDRLSLDHKDRFWPIFIPVYIFTLAALLAMFILVFRSV